MHKGPLMRAVLAEFGPRLTLEQLPSYCPDLNPVEWLWSWIKYAQLANFRPRDLRHLTRRSRGSSCGWPRTSRCSMDSSAPLG
jgi:transposase